MFAWTPNLSDTKERRNNKGAGGEMCLARNTRATDQTESGSVIPTVSAHCCATIIITNTEINTVKKTRKPSKSEPPPLSRTSNCPQRNRQCVHQPRNTTQKTHVRVTAKTHVTEGGATTGGRKGANALRATHLRKDALVCNHVV